LIGQNGMQGLLRSLRRLAIRHDASTTDGELLDCFLRARDEAAFEELVRRHGSMVLGVCRRHLGNADDAEDAFQATFLVLVRKAASIVKRDTVANWLYGVAFRTAQKARVLAARRRRKEPMMARPEAVADDAWCEVRAVLDSELNALPDKYRATVILCDVEGHTRKEAAKLLGCPEGTVSVRLSRAREMLAKRLTRRGCALAGAAAATAILQQAEAALSAPLVSTTVHAAALVAAGHAVGAAVSAPVAALTEGVMRAMCVSKLKIGTALLVALSAFAIGFGLYQASASAAPNDTTVAKAPNKEEKDDKDQKKEGAKDEDKINLPTGATPIQVLASLDKDGKLVIKTVGARFAPLPGGPGRPVPPVPVAPPIGGPVPAPLPAPAPGGGGGGGAGALPAPGVVVPVLALQSTTYDLDDIKVLDTKGKEIDKKDLPKLLKDETVAMASLWGQPVDPLHLRVLKDGTLTFILPAPKPGVGFGLPGVAPPGVIVPAIPVPPAGGGTTLPGRPAPGLPGGVEAAPPVATPKP
jgi:RNA polymerase sigma factor (sigma-70 family)